jgi:hypothetical protein
MCPSHMISAPLVDSYQQLSDNRYYRGFYISNYVHYITHPTDPADPQLTLFIHSAQRTLGRRIRPPLIPRPGHQDQDQD